jgi:hypothetical protein
MCITFEFVFIIILLLVVLLYYIGYHYDELTLNVGLAYSSTMKMEGICSFETFVKFRRTARRYNPEDKIFRFIIDTIKNSI